MNNRFLVILVKVLIIFGMLCGAALIVYVLVNVMPEVDTFFHDEEKPKAFFYIAGAIAVLCVAGGEYIAATLFRMMCSLDKDPFVQANVQALRRMGWTALIVMAMGLGTLLLHPVPLAVIAALPVGMCGLFSLVLSAVFQKAVAFKEENDLTV